MTTCPRTDALISAIALGESLTDFEPHLRDCEACAAAAARADDVARALRAAKAPRGFAESVARRIAAESGQGARAGLRVVAGRTDTPRPGEAGGKRISSDSGRSRRSRGPGLLRLVAAAVLGLAAAGILFAAMSGGRPSRRSKPDPTLEAPSAEVARAPLGPGLSIAIAAPDRLTLGDEVEVAVTLRREAGNGVAFNPVVALALAPTPSLEMLVAPPASLHVDAGQERRVGLLVRAVRPGRTDLALSVRDARGTEVASAGRALEVEPEGRAVELGVSLTLRGPSTRVRALLPPEADRLQGPRSLWLRVVPGLLAEAELGLAELVRDPHGCFEQTSAATYPSLMVLRLSREAGDGDSDLAGKALDRATKGAERLRMFQMPDGGFTIHGTGPSLAWVTAYGIEELTALSRAGVPVERERIDRALARLLEWEDGAGGIRGASYNSHSLGTSGNAGDLCALAFAGNALAVALLPSATARAAGATEVPGAAQDAPFDLRVVRIRDRIEREAMAPDREPYELALSARALRALGRPEAALAVTKRLAAMGEASVPDGLTWKCSRTLTKALGRAADVEATALAAQALAAAGEADLAARAITGLRSLRRPSGWGSTQAAVQALEAFVQVGGEAGLGAAVGRVTALVRDVPVGTADVGGGADAGVAAILGAGARLAETRLSGEGLAAGTDLFALALERGVDVSFEGEGTLRVEVIARGRVGADDALPEKGIARLGGLRVDVERRPGGSPTEQSWTVRVKNEAPAIFFSPMVVVDMPPGFSPRAASLDPLVRAEMILAHEMHGGRLALYLKDLAPKGAFDVSFLVDTRFPGKFKPGTAEVYAYYDRDQSLSLAPEGLPIEVRHREEARAPQPAEAAVIASTGAPAEEPTVAVTAPPRPDPKGNRRSRDLSAKANLLMSWDPALGKLELDMRAFPRGTGEADRLMTRLVTTALPDIAEETVGESAPAGSDAETLSRSPLVVTWTIDLTKYSKRNPAEVTSDEVLAHLEAARELVLSGVRAPLTDATQIQLARSFEVVSAAGAQITLRWPAEIRSALAQTKSSLSGRLRQWPFRIGRRDAERIVSTGAFFIERLVDGYSLSERYVSGKSKSAAVVVREGDADLSLTDLALAHVALRAAPGKEGVPILFVAVATGRPGDAPSFPPAIEAALPSCIFPVNVEPSHTSKGADPRASAGLPPFVLLSSQAATDAVATALSVRLPGARAPITDPMAPEHVAATDGVARVAVRALVDAGGVWTAFYMDKSRVGVTALGYGRLSLCRLSRPTDVLAGLDAQGFLELGKDLGTGDCVLLWSSAEDSATRPDGKGAKDKKDTKGAKDTKAKGDK